MRYSKRGQILAEVLEYINSDDWDRVGDFLVFGKAAFEQFGEEIGPDRGIENSLREFATKRKVNDGARIVAKRISLAEIPKDSTVEDVYALVSALTEEDRRNLQRSFEDPEFATSSITRRDPADALDVALASEAVRAIEGSLERVLTFDEIDLGTKSIKDAAYFEEAHRCDLAGRKMAAAVMCRAILESALIEQIDPKLSLKSGKSHIGAMIDQASVLHLDKKRVIAAKRIHQAGNDAIHDLPSFNLKYACKMHNIIDDTRKVIIDLYK